MDEITSFEGGDFKNHSCFWPVLVGSRAPLERIAGGAGEDILKNRNSLRHTGCLVKNDDFGGVFHPLAGKLFSVTKSISRNGKHSLLSPETYNVPGT